MKIYVNRAPVNRAWGGGSNFFKALFECLEKSPDHQLIPPTDQITAPDVLLLVGLDNDGTGISAEQAVMYKSMIQGKRDVKLILRVNECDARKNTKHVDRGLLELSKYIDGTVFVSNWMRDYFLEKDWKCRNHTTIPNGVDGKIFKPADKLNNNKINIVSHHWSDNPMKGFDVYEKLDKFVGNNNDKFTYAYIGRDRRTFKHTNVIPPLFGQKLGDELGRYDVYVSASRFDPGPNHIAESISCELPTYVHADGGGCVEFAGSDHTYRNWEELQKILVDGQFTPNSTKFSVWSDCVDQYVKFLEGLVK